MISEKVNKILTELYKDPKTGLRGVDADRKSVV